MNFERLKIAARSQRVAILKGILTNLNTEFLEPVIYRGLPQMENYQALDNLASISVSEHREPNFMDSRVFRNLQQ
jgi:hypothetical protein